LMLLPFRCPVRISLNTINTDQDFSISFSVSSCILRDCLAISSSQILSDSAVNNNPSILNCIM
jgi:hypothetical protein